MWTIIIRLLKELIPIIFKSSKPTAEDGQGAGEIEKKLRDKIKEDWNE